jgi:hypothetical protein
MLIPGDRLFLPKRFLERLQPPGRAEAFFDLRQAAKLFFSCNFDIRLREKLRVVTS